jgi:hypothetical protein
MPARLPWHIAEAIDRYLRVKLETDPQELIDHFGCTYSTVMRRKVKIRLELATGKAFPQRKPGP